MRKKGKITQAVKFTPHITRRWCVCLWGWAFQWWEWWKPIGGRPSVKLSAAHQTARSECEWLAWPRCCTWGCTGKKCSTFLLLWSRNTHERDKQAHVWFAWHASAHTCHAHCQRGLSGQKPKHARSFLHERCNYSRGLQGWPIARDSGWWQLAGETKSTIVENWNWIWHKLEESVWVLIQECIDLN